MKEKILLVTLEGLINFGNRLQHYALQTAIEKCGFQVNSLMVKRQPVVSIKTKLKRMIKKTFAFFGNKKMIYSLSKEDRAERFIDFNNKHIHNAIHISVDQVRCFNWEEYAFAVTGSDQVWHNWHTDAIPNELSYYYLEFVEKKKRISYAPSFGFTSFPEEDLESHRRGLSEMQALSCREKEGCELIEQLTGRKAKNVLDPTLLLTVSDWTSIEEQPSFIMPNQYVLLVFLGEITYDYQEEISRIATERGLETLNINNLLDSKYFAVSPEEFIWLVRHAEVVCTDSFHASVFSIIFERNLRVFKRKQPGFEEMFGRIYDLLSPLGLIELVYGEGERLSTTLNEEAYTLLESARENSFAYLQTNLNMMANS